MNETIACYIKLKDGTLLHGICSQGIARFIIEYNSQTITDCNDLTNAQIAFRSEPDITLIKNGAFTIDVSKK